MDGQMQHAGHETGTYRTAYLPFSPLFEIGCPWWVNYIISPKKYKPFNKPFYVSPKKSNYTGWWAYLPMSEWATVFGQIERWAGESKCKRHYHRDGGHGNHRCASWSGNCYFTLKRPPIQTAIQNRARNLTGWKMLSNTDLRGLFIGHLPKHVARWLTPLFLSPWWLWSSVCSTGKKIKFVLHGIYSEIPWVQSWHVDLRLAHVECPEWECVVLWVEGLLWTF